MIPVERLNAAIEKLEALKAGSTQGLWEALPADEYVPREGELDIFGPDDEFLDYRSERALRPDGPYAEDAGYFRRPDDARLIVTLHRTIDAQLAILEQGQRYVRVGLRFGAIETTALALADAILGGAS